MRIIEVPIAEILSLVHCAEDYGHGNSVFLDAMASWCDRQVSDVDVESYVSELLKNPSYGEDDADIAREVLGAWRGRYCKRNGEG